MLCMCVCLSVCLLLLNASKITEHRGFISKLILSGPMLSEVNDKEQMNAQKKTGFVRKISVMFAFLASSL